LAASGTALAAASVSGVLLLSSGASVAYAGWTPTPTTPSATALASAIAQCKKLAPPLDPSLRTAVGHSRAERCTGKPVLAEARGKYVALIYAESGQMNELVTGGDQATTGFQGPVPRAPAPDRLTTPSMAVPNPALQGPPAVRLEREITHLKALERQLQGYRGSISLLALQKYHFAGLAQLLKGDSDSQAIDAVQRRITSMSQRTPQPATHRKGQPQLAYAFGRAGTAISAVTFNFANGKTVKATVENGWYFAWWPWASSPTSAQMVTTSGRATMPLKR
jgi:hypothetical protein